MLILSFGCLRFLRESCLLYSFLLGYLPSIFFGLFLQNLLTFICRTPFLRTWLNDYRQSKTAVQPENSIIALIQAEIADNIFSLIILWLTNASWNNGSSIVLCQLLVAAVHYHIIPGIGIRRSFAVVRNQKSRCSAKVVKRMNVAV